MKKTVLLFTIVAAHGSRQLPIRGSLFHDRNRDDAVLKLRGHNLTEYIKSIQR